MESKDRLELDVTIADREYFLRQASSGLVAGPKSKDGFDRHITVAMDLETEQVKHIHMKSGRKGLLNEDWRIHPSRVMPTMAAWIRDNSLPLGPDEIRDLDKSSYSISVRRILTSLRIVEVLGTRFVWVMCRGLSFVSLRIVENENEARFSAIIDPSRLLKVMRQLRPFRRPIETLIRASYLRLLKRTAMMHLVKLKDMSEGDICLVFPRGGREPIVVVKHATHLSLPLQRVYREVADWYSRLKIAELWPEFNPSPEKPLPMEFTLRGSWLGD